MSYKWELNILLARFSIRDELIHSPLELKWVLESCGLCLCSWSLHPCTTHFLVTSVQSKELLMVSDNCAQLDRRLPIPSRAKATTTFWALQSVPEYSAHVQIHTHTHMALNINIGCQQMSPRNRDNHPDSTDSLQAQWTKKFRASLLYSHLPGTRHCSTLMRVCYQGPSP